MARVTIKDIARISGYSKTTVSFAFNDPKRIGKETREKILRIAEELGYVPDPVARNLSLRHQGTIGLLLPEVISFAFFNPYLSQIVQGIGEVCERENYSLTLIPPIRESLMEGVRRAAVDGLITIGLEPGMETVDFIRRRHLPFVAIDGRVGGGFPVVGIDDRGAAATAMRHVLELGHREIAIVAFCEEPRVTTGSYVKAERLAGYREALEAVDTALIDEASYVYAVSSLDGGRQAAQALLDGRRQPTAIVAMSDILALGIMEQLEEYDIAVPEEITVVGFDNIPEARLVRPRLTTISQPGYDKGRHAADSLMTLIVDEKSGPGHIVLKTELVVRDSSGSSRTVPLTRG
ncbi:MAG: substrate-binding domain-containing protein [Spirochaetales bacterium]|nr:substrate-binding domain-containing protein [Spirochaetales bacterium]